MPMQNKHSMIQTSEQLVSLSSFIICLCTLLGMLWNSHSCSTIAIVLTHMIT